MWRWLRWLPLLLLVLYLSTGIKQIQPNERAVVRRFGRVLEDKPHPGLHIGLPWGMDRVDRIQVDRVQSVTFGYLNDPDENAPVTAQGQYLTGDRNVVNIRVVVNYTADAESLEDYLEQAPVTENVLERAGESVLAEWLAGRRVEEVLLPNNVEIQARLIRALQQRIAPYRLGVDIQTASIVFREVPAGVKDAFDDVNKAMQEKQTRQLEAKQYESQTLTQAGTNANKMRQDADVAYDSAIRTAEVDRDSFNQHLKNAPKPGKDRDEYLRLQWWQQIGSALIEMRKDGRVQDVDQFVTRKGLDIVLPMSMRSKK
jgi:membrane protease subunit HflK